MYKNANKNTQNQKGRFFRSAAESGCIYYTSCAVVSVFWLQQEIVIGCRVYKKDSYLLLLPANVRIL
jgi:hypothetical protein